MVTTLLQKPNQYLSKAGLSLLKDNLCRRICSSQFQSLVKARFLFLHKVVMLKVGLRKPSQDTFFEFRISAIAKKITHGYFV